MLSLQGWIAFPHFFFSLKYFSENVTDLEKTLANPANKKSASRLCKGFLPISEKRTVSPPTFPKEAEKKLYQGCKTRRSSLTASKHTKRCFLVNQIKAFTGWDMRKQPSNTAGRMWIGSGTLDSKLANPVNICPAIDQHVLFRVPRTYRNSRLSARRAEEGVHGSSV